MVAPLIAELAASDREATNDEVRTLRDHVAERGFDPDARERVRGRGAGVFWRGRRLHGGDTLPPAEAHYVRHVLAGSEWPTGTTLDDFVESIRRVVRDDRSGVILSHYHGVVQVGFIGRAAQWKGPRGRDWILVEFRQEFGRITTAFQIDSPEDVLEHARRSAIRWLRSPH